MVSIYISFGRNLSSQDWRRFRIQEITPLVLGSVVSLFLSASLVSILKRLKIIGMEKDQNILPSTLSMFVPMSLLRFVVIAKTLVELLFLERGGGSAE